jgi:hypothetical protein
MPARFQFLAPEGQKNDDPVLAVRDGSSASFDFLGTFED